MARLRLAVHPRIWPRARPSGSSIRAVKRFVDLGYLRCGSSLEELAEAIKVNADNLIQSIASHNRFAQSGIDEAFGEGANAFNRHNGDATNTPNPCLRAIASPPYYAVAVYPADLGTSTGLTTNEHAQVLDRNGLPISGLYACGNDMNSVMAGAYPGPGTTLGPAMVFAFRAVAHISGESRATAIRFLEWRRRLIVLAGPPPRAISHGASALTPYLSVTAAATNLLRPSRPGLVPWAAHHSGNVFGSMRTRMTTCP